MHTITHSLIMNNASNSSVWTMEGWQRGGPPGRLSGGAAKWKKWGDNAQMG